MVRLAYIIQMITLRHYLNEMREYMPPEHRKMIEDVESKSNAKELIHQSKKLNFTI